MEVLSSAWRTDLALLAASGSEVRHAPARVLVRTPDGGRWGNFVLLRRVPLAADLPGLGTWWAERYPGLTPAWGFDDPYAGAREARALTRLGYRVEESVVLTCDRPASVPRPGPSVEIRLLADDRDWERRRALLTEATGGAPGAHALATAQVARERRLAADGLGDWFGAFVHDRLAASVGVLLAGDLARLQRSHLAAGARGHGLTSPLLHAATTHALEVAEARRVVVVADPEHHAIGRYARLGFTATERQLRAALPRVAQDSSQAVNAATS